MHPNSRINLHQMSRTQSSVKKTSSTNKIPFQRRIAQRMQQPICKKKSPDIPVYFYQNLLSNWSNVDLLLILF